MKESDIPKKHGPLGVELKPGESIPIDQQFVSVEDHLTNDNGHTRPSPDVQQVSHEEVERSLDEALELSKKFD